jgi:hypothetical protein
LPYPAVSADALFEIGAAIISSVLSLNERLSQTTLLMPQNCVTSWCIAVLFGTAFSGYALLNAL